MRIAALLLTSLPFCVLAAKPGPSTSSVPLTVSVYTQFWDEQNTNVYFNNPETCPFYDQVKWDSNLLPDALDGPTSQWDFFNWNVKSGLQSGVYDNGANSATGSCLRAEFSTSDKVFSLDTRTSTPLRKLTVDLGDPQPGTSIPSLGALVTTPALLQVSGTDSFLNMGVCSTNACPEARQIATKLWFDDPSASDVQWRVDWRAIRVLRVSSNTWYFIADGCGGSQLAGLSKLTGNRTRPRETLNGYFLIPMFFSAVLK